MLETSEKHKSQIRCPLCDSTKLRVFYKVLAVPASCNRLWKNKKEAVNCPKGDLKLAFCPKCTFISNIAIEPKKNQYDNQYDNSLFYSAHFQEFAKKLAATLVQRYNLHEKNIVEIGGGKVDFLSLLISLGNNYGARFNPFIVNEKTTNLDLKTIDSGAISLPVVNEGTRIDFIFSYHELEHMNNPKKFLKKLRLLLAKNQSVRLFFSVPNSMKDFEVGEYSDIIYEHVSYFTVPSLYFLFSSCGFAISSVEETRDEIFDSIYVDVILKKHELSDSEPISTFAATIIEQTIRRFAAKTVGNIKNLSQQLTNLLDEGNRIVIWGAGARGVTFLNIFKDQRIEYAIDINPCKHGMFVPGTGQKIVSPESLLELQPDYIILANPAYQNEIRQRTSTLGIKPGFILI